MYYQYGRFVCTPSEAVSEQDHSRSLIHSHSLLHTKKTTHTHTQLLLLKHMPRRLEEPLAPSARPPVFLSPPSSLVIAPSLRKPPPPPPIPARPSTRHGDLTSTTSGRNTCTTMRNLMLPAVRTTSALSASVRGSPTASNLPFFVPT